jgi:hypothetical protein
MFARFEEDFSVAVAETTDNGLNMLRQRRQSWITCKFSTKSVKHGKLIGSNRCIQKYPSPFIEQFWRKFLAQAMLVVLFHNIFHAGSQVLRAFPNIVKSLENIPASQGIFFLKFHHISKMSGTKKMDSY